MLDIVVEFTHKGKSRQVNRLKRETMHNIHHGFVRKRDSITMTENIITESTYIQIYFAYLPI